VKHEDRLIEGETKTSHQEEIKIFSKKIILPKKIKKLFPKTASGKENQRGENKNETDNIIDYLTRPN